jgi:hypothetical protein
MVTIKLEVMPLYIVKFYRFVKCVFNLNELQEKAIKIRKLQLETFLMTFYFVASVQEVS